MAAIAEHHAHAPHSSDDVIVRSCLRREILHRSRETCLSRVDQGYEMLMSWLRCHSTAIECGHPLHRRWLWSPSCRLLWCCCSVINISNATEVRWCMRNELVLMASHWDDTATLSHFRLNDMLVVVVVAARLVIVRSLASWQPADMSQFLEVTRAIKSDAMALIEDECRSQLFYRFDQKFVQIKNTIGIFQQH